MFVTMSAIFVAGKYFRFVGRFSVENKLYKLYSNYIKLLKYYEYILKTGYVVCDVVAYK